MHDVVRDHDGEAGGEGEGAPAPVGPDAQGKAHEHEDQSGHGEGEALVELDLERRHDLPLALEVRDGLPERAQAHFLLGLLDALGRPLRVVEGQVEIVEGEAGDAEATRVARVGLADGAVDEAHGHPARLGVGEETPLPRHDDAGELGVALVGDEEPAQCDLRRADVVHVHDHLVEGGAEGALLMPVVARVCRMRKSWFWKAPLAAGATTRVSIATAPLTTTASPRNGLKSRSGLTPTP